MHKMTKEFLETAFAGESQAHMRYLIYSDVAEKAGKPNIARLFRAIAYAEQVHATNHYRELGMVNDTPQNLGVAIDGETFEVEEMYPVYNNTARFQDEKGAELSTHYAWSAEKIHAKMYNDARETAQKNQDINIDTMFICPVCGYTVEGTPPDICPVCGAKKETFKSF